MKGLDGNMVLLFFVTTKTKNQQQQAVVREMITSRPVIMQNDSNLRAVNTTGCMLEAIKIHHQLEQGRGTSSLAHVASSSRDHHMTETMADLTRPKKISWHQDIRHPQRRLYFLLFLFFFFFCYNKNVKQHQCYYVSM